MGGPFPDRQRSKRHQMDNSERDRSAAQVPDLLCSFELALSESKRKYPVREFFSFANAAQDHHIPVQYEAVSEPTFGANRFLVIGVGFLLGGLVSLWIDWHFRR